MANKERLTPEKAREEAAKKAWNSLAKYKFYMFGYWAAVWVNMNKLCLIKKHNPFSGLVFLAEKKIKHVGDNGHGE